MCGGLLAVLLLAAAAWGAEDEAAADTAEVAAVARATPSSDSSRFTCRVLDVEQPGGTRLDASGDSVSFRLFYVDMACSEFTYSLYVRDDSLVVRRETETAGGCDSEEDRLYGVEGTIRGVAPGKYQFVLATRHAAAENMLFRELVIVK
jgi:hypothetical protein